MPFSRTEPNVPAYEEDPNSPFENLQQTTVTLSLANPSDRLVILSDPDFGGHDRLQVNGVTSTDYTSVFNDGTRITGASRFRIGFGSQRTRLALMATDIRVQMTVQIGSNDTNEPVGGATTAATGPISSLTLSNNLSRDRDSRVRVFALDV